MSAAVLSRLSALASALATAGIQLSDDALRGLISISDDFADDLGRALAAGGDDFTAFITQNADDIAKAVGNGGDDAVKALKALAANPQMVRLIGTLHTALDDVFIKFAQSGGDDLGKFVAQNYDDIVIQYGDDVAAAISKHSTQLQTRLSSVASVLDDTANLTDDAVRSVPKPPSTMDQLALKSLINQRKIAFIAIAGTGGVLVAEYTTNHGLSSWAAEKSIDIAGWLENISPELAAKFREFGIDGVMFAADIADTKQAAAINYIAEILDKEGRHNESVAVRVGYVVFNPLVYAEMMLSEEGARAETFIQKLEDSKISRDDLANYLNRHPNQREMIESRLGVDLEQSLPNLTPLAPKEEEIERPSKRVSDFNLAAMTQNMDQNSIVFKIVSTVIGVLTAVFSAIQRFAIGAADTLKAFAHVKEATQNGETASMKTSDELDAVLRNEGVDLRNIPNPAMMV
jgi:hypothetical protein